MVDKERNKCEQSVHYKLEQWKKIGFSNMMNNVSENLTFVKFME